MKSKTFISFRKSEKIYKNIEGNNFPNPEIIKYSYPICVFKNKKKESEEMRKIQNRIFCSKFEKKNKKNSLNFKNNNNNNIKDNFSENKLLFNGNRNKETFKNIKDLIRNKKLLRSNSGPIYPYCKQENLLHKFEHLSQIEKRGNYYNKLLIASLQRHSLNNFSLPDYYKKSKINNNNLNFILNNTNQQSILEEYNNNKLSEVRQFLNNRIISVNEKKDNICDDFNINKKLPRFQKKDFKFHIFHDINGIKKEMTISPIRTLKMTKTKIRDLKVMSSINKIRDPEIIQKYRNLIYG